ncbi:MAG: dihydrofolate reductase family protein [Cyanobacteriota bacterium]|nr:dihydrofolate reductase family protein [Cyanobacteriota bacterium]
MRLVLAISLDGRLAPAEGGPAQLGGKDDRRVLEEALTWADAVLLGGRTLRLHRSSCLIHAPDLLGQRRDLGLAAQPTAVVWSRSGQFSPQLAFFQQPLERWLLSAASAPPAVGEGFHRFLPFRNWQESLAHLGALGVRRLVALGGSQLAAALVAARALDELQLTLCPMLLGGSHGWLPAQATADPADHWTLRRQDPLRSGELLLLYERQERARAQA